MVIMYRQLAITAVATSAAGFAVGAALMGNHIAEHPPPPASPAPTPGITGDVPGVGTTARAIGDPIGDGMCRAGNATASGIPIVGQLSQAATVTATAIDGITGAPQCTPAT